MAYLSLYRKWRPQTFDEVAGQPHITQTLKNAIEKGRVAHAYLFCGPRGTGKTTSARILAKAINCAEGPTPTPCNKCSSCVAINEGASIDVLELDAASNRKVDEIRELLEKIPYSATQGGKKVYIIDEVHMLTAESFNTLLKTLEEPPEHVVFILATTEAHKVLPTILSRCQRFDFRRISVADIETRLREVAEAEKIPIERSALALIAAHSQGALRDALGVLDQLASFSKEKITAADVTALLGLTDTELLLKFTGMLGAADLSGVLLSVDEMMAGGIDLRQFIQDLLGHLRDLFLLQSAPGVDLSRVPEEFLPRLSEQARQLNPRQLLFFINILNDLYNQSRFSTDMRLVFEIALFKMIKAQDDTSAEGILHRLERLESALSGKADKGPQTPVARKQPEAISQTASSRAKAPVAPPIAPAKDERGSVAPAVATVATGPAPDFERIQDGWPQVLKIIKEKKRTRYNFFAAAKLAGIDAQGRLVLTLKQSDKEFIETPENIKLLREAIKVATGFDIPIVCKLEGGAGGINGGKTVAVVETEGPEEQILADEDYIKLVQDTFGAKIVEEISVENINTREDG